MVRILTYFFLWCVYCCRLPHSFPDLLFRLLSGSVLLAGGHNPIVGHLSADPFQLLIRPSPSLETARVDEKYNNQKIRYRAYRNLKETPLSLFFVTDPFIFIPFEMKWSIGGWRSTRDLHPRRVGNQWGLTSCCCWCCYYCTRMDGWLRPIYPCGGQCDSAIGNGWGPISETRTLSCAERTKDTASFLYCWRLPPILPDDDGKASTNRAE